MASSVDNNKNAKAHQTREDYQKREVELKKKHNKELNNLKKAQAEQIRDLQKTHQEQLEGVRLRGQESLSTQDKKHQAEIEKIRSAHRQQSINSAQEQVNRINEIENFYESQLDKERSVNRSREEALEKNYMRSFRDKEEEFRKSVDYIRDKQEQGIIEERNKLENKYQKDANILRKAHDDKVHDLTQELQNTRDSKNAEIKDLKVRIIADKEKLESDKLNLLQQERKKAALHQNYMNEQYHENLDNLRDKYHAYSLDSKSGRAEELRNLEANASKRSRESTDALERRIRSMKADHDMEIFERNNQFRSEKKAYLDEVKKQLDVAETQRQQVYDVANQKTRQEIQDMAKRNDSVLDRLNKYYQGRIQEMNEKYNESIDTQVYALQADQRKDKKIAEIREKKIVGLLQNEKNNLEAYYQEIIDENNKAHQKELADQRAIMIRERNEVIRNLENRIRLIEEKNTDRMNLLAQKYEKEIFDLKEAHKAETKSLVNQYTKRIEEIERNQKMLTETSKIQAENRERQLKEKYENQIDNLRMAHEQEKIKMATKRV